MTAMEKKEREKSQCNHPKLMTVLVFCIILILTLLCSVCYGAVYITRQFDSQNLIISNLHERLANLEAREKSRNENNMKREKREVISSSKADLSSLLRGPAGPPGQPGRDGRDGKDFASLDLLRGVINETVAKELSRLSTSLPAYGGATYIHWGHNSCPSVSKMIYSGQMTGPSWLSAGGGPNWQCLPDDPEYNTKAPVAPHSSLRAAHYRSIQPLINHRIPCAACETEKRVSQIMIPGKVRCPSSDWSLEYRGYLFSTAEYEKHSEDFKVGSYYRGNYVCIDESPESLTAQSHARGGGQLYLVTARCDGSAALHNCPPYQEGKALSCVVCSR